MLLPARRRPTGVSKCCRALLQANLYEHMKSRVRPLPESKIRNIMFQTMQARSA